MPMTLHEGIVDELHVKISAAFVALGLSEYAVSTNDIIAILENGFNHFDDVAGRFIAAAVYMMMGWCSMCNGPHER